MNAWQLSLSHQPALNEYSLKLINNKSNKTWRSWFGPMAWHIFRKAKSHVIKNQAFAAQGNRLLFDKHFAQHLMIEASLHHQFCHQLYRTANDLRQHGLGQDLAAHDLLLYIRMTPQHPCHTTICKKAGLEDEHQLIIERLLACELIQKIVIKQQTFYDKNPHPHDHLFNTETGRLSDCTSHTSNHQQSHLILVKSGQPA